MTDLLNNTPQREVQLSQFPLTDLQQAYWIGEQAGYYLRAPALVHRYYFSESLDVCRLESAITQVVNRHPALRAEFLADCSQRINPVCERAFRIQYIDKRNLIEQHIADRGQRQPQTGNHPVVCRVERDCQGYTICFTFRLIALDGKSILQFINEVVTVYMGRILPTRPVMNQQDFIVKKLAERESVRYQESMAWWMQRIKSLPPAPELPLVDVKHFPENSHFRRRQYRLNQTLAAELRNIARKCEVTINAVLCTVYADIVRMWAKSPLFTLNLLYSQRLSEGREFEQVMGNFTSTLPVEVIYQESSSFKQRAQQFQTQLYRNMAHSCVSGVEIIRAMQQPTGALPAMPVVFASLLGTEIEDESIMPGGTGWNITGSEMSTPQVYLDHQVYMEGEYLILNWDVVEDVFLPGVIEEMFATYTNTIERICSGRADVNLSLLPRVPETYLASRKAANTTSQYLPQGLLHDFIRSAVERYATNRAIIDGATEITYEQLWNASASLALKLQKHCRIQPNDLVAVMAERGWRQVVALLAVVRAGGAYLPIATDLPYERKQFLLSQQGLKAVLWDGDETLQVLPVSSEIPVLSIEHELNLDHIPEEQPVAVFQQPESLAYVIFTSGSTGIPKGVSISHRAAVNTLQDTISRFALDKNDRVIGVSAFNFDLSVFDIFATLSCGAALVLPGASQTPEPEEWVCAIAQHRVTVWNSVPAFVEMLIEFCQEKDKAYLQSLRLIMMSGDWIPVKLPTRLRQIVPNARLVSLGGATEAAIWSNYYDIEEELETWNSIPYGWPLSNQYFYVLDKMLRPSPTWVKGDLYIGGLGLADGYYKDELRTAESFIIHPESGERLYKTGDCGRYRPCGCLEFLGRNDTQVKIRGFRIELGEVETAIAGCANVHDSVVVVRRTESGEQQLLSFYIADGNTTTAEQIGEELSYRLPPYMVPAFIIPVEHFPVTANGKVDRKRLAAFPVETAAESTQKAVVPRNEIERRLALIWEKLLQTRVSDVTRDFFASGGSSLLAVRLLTEISATFGIRLPLASLLHHGTLERQAQLLTEKQRSESDARSPLVVIRPGNGAIVVAVHPVGGNILCYRALADILPDDMAVYGMQSPGDGSPRTVTELAKKYIRSLGTLAENRHLHLIGWSMGGIVAIEMARLLELKKEPVRSVTLLDSWVSAAPEKAIDKPDEELLIRGFMSDFSGGRFLPQEWLLPDLRSADESAVMAISQLKAKNIVPDNFLETEFIPLFREYRENYLALLHHQPRDISAPLYLVCSDSATIKFPWLKPFSPAESFSSTSAFKIKRVAGDHFTVISDTTLKQIVTAADSPFLVTE